VHNLRWCPADVGSRLLAGGSDQLRRFSTHGNARRTEKATSRSGLDDFDIAVFEHCETSNFELVLGRLRDAIALATALGQDSSAYRERFRSVQAALGGAIRGVHVARSEVHTDSLEVIKRDLQRYGAIFSTSYDLIVYWAVGHEEQYGGFRDCFWGPDNSFDPSNCEIWAGNTPTYFMHGALHLIVDGLGRTRKLVYDDRRLLDQFGSSIPGDPEARPLLITEGSARDKLVAIEGNDYLLHAYETLESNAEPLVVFGHSLGAQDQHLIDAINANPARPVAISMVEDDAAALREQRSAIWGKLRGSDVYFFDAATHPLGAGDLSKAPPWKGFEARARRIGAAKASERV